MTRTALSLAFGFGLLGLFAAQSADAALPYSTSRTNWDGSRTLCGPYGCTTVPSTSLYGRSTAANTRYRTTAFDPYSWDSRTRSTVNRYDDWRHNDGWYGRSRYDDYKYNHRLTPISRSYDYWRTRY